MEKISWNSVEFLQEYRAQMARVKCGDSLAYNRIKMLRSSEFANTVALIAQGFYETEGGKRVVFPSDAPMQHGTKFYEKSFHVSARTVGKTAIEVVNEDCLHTAVRLKEQGFNPAVLNMASRRNPGGGVINGAGAQEETLFRRTNLYRSLYQFVSFAGQYGMRTILRIGLEHGHDSLVLGALGCGAFRNPPRHVAKLFHEVMEEAEFLNKYKLLVFAILDDHNAHKSHNPEGNFKPFADEFKGMGRLSSDELKALNLWSMGAGNSAQAFQW